VNFMKNELLEALHEYHEQGISCLPVIKDNKNPSSKWTHLQNHLQPLQEVEKLFQNHDGNIGILGGAASGNLACLDIEVKGLFREMSEEFKLHHGETWIVESARGGHIYFRTPQPVRGRKYKDYEVRGQGQFMVAPPSVVRTKDDILHRYEFVTKPEGVVLVPEKTFFPLDYIPKIDVETEVTGRDIVLTRNRIIDDTYTVEKCLTAFNEVSRNGINYPSRSNFDHAIVATLVNRGAPLDVITSAFFRATKADTRFQWKRRKNGHNAAIDYLKGTYTNAYNQEDTEEYKGRGIQVASTLEHIHRAIEENPDWWKGRGKQTDRAVFEAHIKKYGKCKKDEWNISNRDGGVTCKISPPSFSRSTTRLIKNGLLREVKEDYRKYGHAKLYGFGDRLQSVIKESQNVTFLTTNIVLICNVKNTTETYGVFDNGVKIDGKTLLGRSAETIYFTLLIKGPMKVKDIVNCTGLSPDAARKACKRLELYSLIVGMNRVYSAIPDYDFKALSDTYDALGPTRKRLDSCEEDRKNYKEIIELKARYKALTSTK
jgi:Mn-dependent DtxR family transcriptional regulator